MVELFDPFADVRKFEYSGSVRATYPLSPKPKVPSHIRRPNYGREALFPSRRIRVNNAEEQEGVRVAAKLARESLDLIAAMIQPGITTDELDQALFKAAIERGCYPSPLGYHGFPKSVCTSVNEVICHGIPDQRKLEDGDIINLGTCSMLMPDVTLYHNGAYLFLTCNQASTATCTLLYSPRNATYPVGDKARENAEWMKLIRTARYARLFPDRSECLDAAIAICGPGMPYAEVGRVIQPIVERNGCCIVKNYTGHGIGRVFHGPPPVFHYPTKKSYGIMQPGHPMVNLGQEWREIEWPDDWTIATRDGSPSAAAEETLLITETGVEILTAHGGPRVLDTTEARERYLAARGAATPLAP